MKIWRALAAFAVLSGVLLAVSGEETGTDVQALASADDGSVNVDSSLPTTQTTTGPSTCFDYAGNETDCPPVTTVVPTTAVPTTAVPTTAVPTTQVPTTTTAGACSIVFEVLQTSGFVDSNDEFMIGVILVLGLRGEDCDGARIEWTNADGSTESTGDVFVMYKRAGCSTAPIDLTVTVFDADDNEILRSTDQYFPGGLPVPVAGCPLEGP